MADRSPITAEYLRSRLDYDPTSGYFVWRSRPKPPGQINDGGWNKRCAGKLAGSVDGQGYQLIVIDNRSYRAHRLAWLYVHGNLPSGRLDHIDENRLNNSILNLRPATHAENLWNRGRPKHNTSGVKGVCFEKKARRWRAEIAVRGKRIYLGRHRTKEAAKAAYDAAAAKYHGEFANKG